MECSTDWKRLVGMVTIDLGVRRLKFWLWFNYFVRMGIKRLSEDPESMRMSMSVLFTFTWWSGICPCSRTWKT